MFIDTFKQTAVLAFLESLVGKDFATETTLEEVRDILASLEGKEKDVATEATLEDVRDILAILEGKDFATENTLATLASKDFATEAKLEAVRAILASLEGKDFATESTLSTLVGKDFATETTLFDVKEATEGLDRKQILLTDEPVTGQKTIDDSASPLYAEASPLPGRRQLTAYNDGDHTVYVGGAGVNSQTGFPVLPGQSVTVHFDPEVYVPLYAVTEPGQTVVMRIWESR